MLSLAFESFWLWYLAGITLWAFIGMLIAARYGLPVVLGIALGALFWIGGVVVLLIVGMAHRGHRSGVQEGFPPAETTTSFAFSRSGQDFGGLPSPMTTTGFPPPGSGFPPSASTGFPGVAHLPGDAFMQTGGGFGTSNPGVTSLGGLPAASQSRRRARYTTSTRHIAIAVAGLGALGIFLSIVLPWGEGSVVWSKNHGTVSGGVSPDSAFPVAVAIALSGAVVLGSGLLMHRRPHIAWPMLAATTTTWWFCVVVEWLFVESHAAGLVGPADNLAGNTAALSLSTASGVWIMLVACCAVYAWCALVSYGLVRSNTTRMSDYAAPRRASRGL